MIIVVSDMDKKNKFKIIILAQNLISLYCQT